MRRRLVSLGLVFVLIAAACGSDGGGDNASSPDTTAPSDTADPFATPDTTDGSTDTADTGEDPCAGVTLEATDLGISADTITIAVMADNDQPLQPGLFKAAWDGVEAAAEAVNDAGGVGCRQLEVITLDSKLNPTEGENGVLRACSDAAAMVGTTALVVNNKAVSDMNSCPDQAGNPTGILDLAGLTSDAGHTCSENTFPITPITSSCPYSGTGERTYSIDIGASKWLIENRLSDVPDLKGMYLIALPLQNTIAGGMAAWRALQQGTGIGEAGVFGINGPDPQSTFAPYVQKLDDPSTRFVQNGSSDEGMLKFVREAGSQNRDLSDVVLQCSSACYTANMLSSPADAEGVYASLAFLPYEERDINEEMDAFLTAIGTDSPDSWAVNAWLATKAFVDVIDRIVASDGPNAITREAILATIATTTDFDANGMIPPRDFTQRGTAGGCYVLLQVQGGEWVRLEPEEPGTFHCDPADVAEVTLDGFAEYGG